MDDDSQVNADKERYFEQHKPHYKRRQADPFRDQPPRQKCRSSSNSSRRCSNDPMPRGHGGAASGQQPHNRPKSTRQPARQEGAAQGPSTAAHMPQVHPNIRLVVSQQQTAAPQPEVQLGPVQCGSERQAKAPEPQQPQQQQQQQQRPWQQQQQYQAEQPYLRQQSRRQDEAAIELAHALYEQAAANVATVARRAQMRKQATCHARRRRQKSTTTLAALP